jgi:hypothetical protein
MIFSGKSYNNGSHSSVRIRFFTLISFSSISVSLIKSLFFSILNETSTSQTLISVHFMEVNNRWAQFSFYNFDRLIHNAGERRHCAVIHFLSVSSVLVISGEIIFIFICFRESMRKTITVASVGEQR